MAELYLESSNPGLQTLPWEFPLHEWSQHTSCLEDVPKGLSRNPIVFVNLSGEIYAIKQLPGNKAEDEFITLNRMVELRLPVITPTGYARFPGIAEDRSLLITRYLESSLPYRLLFLQPSLERYRVFLLDAMASLLVQLHLAGVYWGDCSLSNTLFRRDAGILQAYLVDAETAEIHDRELTPLKRSYDLEIMEENILGDLVDVERQRESPFGIPLMDIPAYIRFRYDDLWRLVTQAESFQKNEDYRIQERIKNLNSLGFSVRNVEIIENDFGQQLSFKVVVTDRNYHKDQLYSLTGLDAQEMQARQMMNEINQVKARRSTENNRSEPLSVSAYYWLENYYKPVIEQLKQNGFAEADLVEAYCQILEHKWFLSEKAKRDVGHQFATEDYIRTQQLNRSQEPV